MAKTESKKCCICGKRFKGWGNNPWGALDKDNKTIVWGENDLCCDKCNREHVLTGRLYIYNKMYGGKN